MTRKKAMLIGWITITATATVATLISFLGLSQENKNIIISIVFFTTAIPVVILWIAFDYIPWPFSLIQKKLKIEKKDS